MIEAGIAKTSSSKKFSLSHLRNGTCQVKVANSENLLELIENDAFVSSFMHALSEMAPEWLTLTVSETNEAFDIPNIAVNLASDSEHCSGFPLSQASSLAYYRPAVNYKLRVAQNEVPLFADGRTCFAINICKTGLFINFGKEQAELLKGTLDVFKHMKDSGLDLQVDSIGLFEDKQTARFVKGVVWNGITLQQLTPFEYNMWLKGSLQWKMKTPELLFVTFKVTGETIIKSENIDSLFIDRMYQRMEMQLKGKAFVNISGRALNKYFAFELSPTAITGKAVLGGRKTCSNNPQGIFFTLERSASNLLNESPFSAYIRPTKTEPVRLAILASLSGGRQNKILKIKEVKHFLNYLYLFVPQLQNVFLEANSILPEGKVVLKGSLHMMQHLKSLMGEMDKVVAGERINLSQFLTLLHRINIKIEYLKKILDLIKERSLLSSNIAPFAQLLRTIDRTQELFPDPLRVNLGGEHVETNLQGISFYLRCNLCIGKLCINDLSATIDYLAEGNCFTNASVSTFRAKGKVLKTMSLSEGNVLTLPKGQVIDMVFPRDSDIVSAHFLGEIQLFEINQETNVTLDKKQLSFQIQGEIFNKYMANMKVAAETNHALDWSSLSFTVDGRMRTSSLLSQSLQTRMTNFTKCLVQKAAKRVGKCEESILRIEQRLLSAKKLADEKQSILNDASREKQRKSSKLQRTKSAYEKASTELNSSLTKFLKVKNKKICELQTCSYINTDTCIPTVCQKEITVSYAVPNCRKVKESIQREVVVSKIVVEEDWVQTYVVEHHSDCGKTSKVIETVGLGISAVGMVAIPFSPVIGAVTTVGGFFVGLFGSAYDSMFACDNYKVKVPGRKVKVKYNVAKNFRESRKYVIDNFVCDTNKTESVISGYRRPFECCKKEVSGKMIKVLDPNCVSHNSYCFRNMTILADEIKFENETMFGEFQIMRKTGKQATLAQLEANKARIKFDMAENQLELARARLKQHEFARKAINLTTVKLREKLGLKLGEKMKNLDGKALIFVDSLAFSVSMTRSSTKTRFPLTAYVRTFEGSYKAIQFPMNFRQENDSLTSASKLIVENLFGTYRSRRRRSAREDLVASKINDIGFPLEQHGCLFSQEARIFFTDVVESLDFAIKNKNELEETMSAGLRGLEKLPSVEDKAGEFPTGPWQQIRASFSDTIQYLKDAQFNSSGTISWNNTLNDVRGFLDVFTQEKNFTECSGVQDCTDFFFDSLEEMYEMEYHPRAVEIKAMLNALEKVINSMLEKDHAMSTLENMVLQAKLLINNSNDDIILCGKKPKIVRNSPVEFVAILGETVHLVCEANSTLEMEYLWMKNGQPLEETNSTVLKLVNVTEESEGAYKCQASNKRGSTLSNVTIVVVHQRPNITEQPPDAQGLVGDEIFSMVCNSTGVPRPLTEWFFIPMKGDYHDVVRVNTIAPVLRMPNLTTANAGFYYCNVSNLHGKVQSRMARLDVFRFVPGVPRTVVSLKLKKCMSATSPGNSRSQCNVNAASKSQQLDSAAFQYITRKIFERMRWPVERIESKLYNPFPSASISFVVNGDDSSLPEGKRLEALNSFALSRRRMGNSLKSLYSALEDESMKFKWKHITISGDKESLVLGFLPQGCPHGTRRHENGFLCVYCSPGYYGVANGTCLQCPVGTYQPDEGSTQCLKCPFRILSTEPGAVRESQCNDISIPCKPPEITIKGAQALKLMKDIYRSGETVVLSCEPGYRVVGNGTQECNEGNWTTSNFYCEKTCFPPWSELKKQCYLAIEAPTHRWKDASAKCLNLNSHMVTISSEEENEFTGQLAKIYLEGKELGQVQMWLGLRKLHAKGHFQWVDGSPLEGYTNWSSGEPNNTDCHELCAEFLVSGKFWLNKWNDVNCDITGYKTITVCEKPLREGD